MAFFMGFAQGQVTIKGKVIDANSKEGLAGATVMVKDAQAGAYTDVDGSFAIRKQNLPVTLVINYFGYKPKEVPVSSADKTLMIKMEEDIATTDVVVIEGQRISDKQKAAPLTVESLDIIAIKETSSDNFYDGLGKLKGVDLTAASLGFKIINTRGFNSTSPVRSLQIIDGVDNQAPGLNFSLGNFLGSSELDVAKVDIIVGASSSFYGPNAFNGVISMETKNPFIHKGLAVSLKGGERQLFEGAVRWADAIKNKDSLEVFAYKLNFSYLRANDWVADNYDPLYDSRVDGNNPGRFDAVNIYGDEYFSLNDASTTPLWNDPGLGIYYRTGYREVDLVDYGTQNIKANVALHFRTQPKKELESPEFIISSSFGNGTTVYQGDNRFSLRGIRFFQNRLEYRKKDKFFIRAFATNEDAGRSYDPYFTALKLQDVAKTDEIWGLDYRSYWTANVVPRIRELGYPELEFNPNTGMFEFDTEAAQNWLVEYQDSLAIWHAQAEAAANVANPDPVNNSVDFLAPGTDRFQTEFDRIRSAKSNREENGTLFYDRSALYHIHGEYKFTPSFMEHIIVGGNGRLYTPKSDGTIFSDTISNITNYEFGAYLGLEKRFLEDRLIASATVRLDKNQNFKFVSTPAASLVFKPTANNFMRVSFASAIRNPTLTDQYLFLDVGRATLVGNLNGADSLLTVESFVDFLSTLNPDTLSYFNIAPVQPERVKTVEFGYRTTLFNSLYLDASYYFSIYNDFLGYNIGIDAEFSQSSGLPTETEVFRYAANSTNQVTTQGFTIGANYYFADYFMLGGNYSWNRLNKTFEDDPIIPAFNTPEHKFNIGLSGRNIRMNLGKFTLKNWGFNVNYKWIQGFLFEGSPQFTGFIPTYDLVDAQINYTVEKWHTTFKLGASNLLNNKQFQTYGGPRIGRLAYFSILYDFKKL